MTRILLAPVLAALLLVPLAGRAGPSWPSPQAPVVPQADGYVAIPGVAFAPSRAQTYKAVFDATLRATDPAQLVPALNMAGSELNALGASHVPLGRAKFAIVFHGDAVDGLLDDKAYRAKYGRANPNLPVLAEMKATGTQVLVCGQYLAFAHIDPDDLSPDATVASDALLVLIGYQNRGYALLSF